jgi:hypothetical protein
LPYCVGYLFGWQICCIPIGLGAVTGIETALYFIFPEEDETIVCGTVEVKAVEDLFQMRFYPLSQPADSPFDQNLFAE